MRKPIIVVGAGFGGLFAARRLARRGANVTVVDRRNFHTFTPLLYQVAAAELEPEEIAYPVRTIFRGRKNVRMVLGEVEGVDLLARTIQVDERVLEFEDLILATGSTTSFFGVSGAAENTLPLKTPGDAVRLRSHILGCFERATLEPEMTQRRRLMTFAIVGGGPTGVEYAGALTELIRGPLARDFPSLDLRECKVILLEASHVLLGSFPPRLGAYARRRLGQMDVDVRLEARVSSIAPGAVKFDQDEPLVSATIVWTAGVRGDPILAGWGLPVGRDGRVRVEPTLQVKGHPHVYVVGDGAFIEQEGTPVADARSGRHSSWRDSRR